jgi:hypothetical protein
MASRHYTGPAIPDILSSKTLAENVIKYQDHPSSASSLDENNLRTLQRFTRDPSKRKEVLLAERDWV